MKMMLIYWCNFTVLAFATFASAAVLPAHRPEPRLVNQDLYNPVRLPEQPLSGQWRSMDDVYNVVKTQIKVLPEDVAQDELIRILVGLGDPVNPNANSKQLLSDFQSLAAEIDCLPNTDRKLSIRKVAAVINDLDARGMGELDAELTSRARPSFSEVSSSVKEIQDLYKDMTWDSKYEPISRSLSLIKRYSFDPDFNWDYMEGSQILTRVAEDVWRIADDPIVRRLISLNDIRLIVREFKGQS